MKKKLIPFVVSTLIISLINTGFLGYLVYDKINSNIQNRPVVISRDYDKGQSYEKAQATGKPMVVWFYADWCRYCQKFAPTFKKLTNKKEVKNAYAIAYVNADMPENKELVKKFKVEGYPTVYLVNGIKQELVEPMSLFVPDAHKVLKDKFLKFLEQ